MMLISEKIGARIREARKARGMSITFICEKLGQNPRWLSEREHGHIQISAEDLLAIAEFLHMPVQHFYYTDAPISEKLDEVLPLTRKMTRERPRDIDTVLNCSSISVARDKADASRINLLLHISGENESVIKVSF